MGLLLTLALSGCSETKEKAEAAAKHAAAVAGMEGALAGLKAGGAQKYKIVKSGNDNICEKCQAMDGKEFGIDEAVIGETAPPFHPNCGCSIVGEEKDKYIAPPYSLSSDGATLLAKLEYGAGEEYVYMDGVKGIPMQILGDGKYTYGYGYAVDSIADAPSQADENGWMSIEDALDLLVETVQYYADEVARMLADEKSGDLSNLQLTQNEVDALIILCYNRPVAIYAIKEELRKDRTEWDYQSFLNTIMNDYPDNPKFNLGWENRTKETLDLFFKE